MPALVNTISNSYRPIAGLKTKREHRVYVGMTLRFGAVEHLETHGWVISGHRGVR